MPYPNPPGPRVAYDLDGSAVLVGSQGQVFDVHPNAIRALNSERAVAMRIPTSVMVNSRVYPEDWIALLFPVPLRIRGVYVACTFRNNFAAPGAGSRNCTVESSVNSTNGVDGDWLALLTATTSLESEPPVIDPSTPVVNFDTGASNTGAMYTANDRYRRLKAAGGVGIIEVNGTPTRHVRAIRLGRATADTAFVGGNDIGYMFQVHVYGEVDTSATDARVAFWRITTAEPVSPTWFDWGDVPPGSSADKSFRLKNLSATETALGIVIDAIRGASTTDPAPDASLLFSTDDGETWDSSVEIAALSPGAVTGTLLVRRVTPLSAVLSNWAPRITAEVGSWS